VKFSGNAPFNHWDQKQVLINKFRAQQRDNNAELTDEEGHQENYKYLYQKAKRDLDKLQKKYEDLKKSELDQRASGKQYVHEFETLPLAK